MPRFAWPTRFASSRRLAPFLCSQQCCPRAAACPATPSRRSATRRSSRSDVRSLARRRRALDAATGRRRRGHHSRPPELQALRCQQAQDRTGAGPGPAAPDRRPVQDAVQAGVRGPARPGAAVPDLRRVDPGRGQGPGRQGLQEGDRQGVPAAEEAVVPQRGRLQAVPEDLRLHAQGHPLPRQARPALQQDPRQGHQGQEQGHRRSRSPPTTRRTSRASPSPSAATSRSC